MLELEANANDDPAFLHLAGRLITGAARAYTFSTLVIVHINHWFGARWLGFCGKLLGAASVRSRRLTGPLTPPPFHPHRIHSVREYRLTEAQTYEYQGDVRWLHGYWPSQANIYRTFPRNRLYAWYSGHTAESDKGVVMVYLVQSNWNAAWYVAFDKTPQWHLTQTLAIAPRRVQELMERSVPEQRPS
jgi:hypothetical protein